MTCGCKARREKIMNWFRSWFSRPLITFDNTGITQDARYADEMLSVLEKFGLSGIGPEATDEVDKKTIVYNRNITWVLEYDDKTKRLMQAKRREDDYQAA